MMIGPLTAAMILAFIAGAMLDMCIQALRKKFPNRNSKLR